MTVHLANLSSIVLVYALVFARTGAMIMLLPSIGDAGIPSRVRLALALAVSFAMTPVVAHAYPQEMPQSAMAFGLMLAQEVTAGSGRTMSRIIMSALSVAGSVIATQTGLAYAQSVDPSMGEQARLWEISFAAGYGPDLRHRSPIIWPSARSRAATHCCRPARRCPPGDMAELALRLVSGSFGLGFSWPRRSSFSALPSTRDRPSRAHDAAIADVLHRDADQHPIRLPADDAAARLDDDGVPQLLRHEMAEFLVADDRDDKSQQTEEPTQRRLDRRARARRRRQEHRSHDLRRACGRHAGDRHVRASAAESFHGTISRLPRTTRSDAPIRQHHAAVQEPRIHLRGLIAPIRRGSDRHLRSPAICCRASRCFRRPHQAQIFPNCRPERIQAACSVSRTDSNLLKGILKTRLVGTSSGRRSGRCAASWVLAGRIRRPTSHPT
jgi:flagellar biosynthetic protein FliR